MTIYWVFFSFIARLPPEKTYSQNIFWINNMNNNKIKCIFIWTFLSLEYFSLQFLLHPLFLTFSFDILPHVELMIYHSFISAET